MATYKVQSHTEIHEYVVLPKHVTAMDSPCRRILCLMSRWSRGSHYQQSQALGHLETGNNCLHAQQLKCKSRYRKCADIGWAAYFYCDFTWLLKTTTKTLSSQQAHQVCKWNSPVDNPAYQLCKDLSKVANLSLEHHMIFDRNTIYPCRKEHRCKQKNQ